MKKLFQFVGAVVVLSALGAIAFAATAVLTNSVNIAQIAGVAITLGQKAMSASFPVVIASDQSALPVTTTVVTTGLTSSGNGVPVQTRATCTTSSGLMLAANANRIGLECDTDVGNTDRLFTKWGAASATNTDKRIETGASWQPPIVSTVAVQCISNSGSQIINCLEYNK